MLLGWIAIFAVIFVLFSFRSDFVRLWNHVKADIVGTSTDANGMVRIKKGEDGHFTARVMINGKSLQMLVDTGATTTVISGSTAAIAGVQADSPSFPVPAETANGTIMLQRGRAESFSIGAITRDDFRVLISDRDDLDVIGMNFLSSLSSWRVEGDELILVP